LFNESSCVCVVTLPDADDAVLLDAVDVVCALSEEAAEPVAAAESPVTADVGGNAEPERAPALEEDAEVAESPVAALAPLAAVAEFVFAAELAAGALAPEGVDNRSELALEEVDFEMVNSPAACAVASAVSLSDDGTN
jgi:hypothetical protein